MSVLKTIQDKLILYLKKNDPSITEVKLCPSDGYKKDIIKLAKHQIPVATKKSISDKTLFVYKVEQKDAISGETVVVERTIPIGQLNTLLDNNVFTVDELYQAFNYQTQKKHESRKTNAVNRNSQGMFIHNAKFDVTTEERKYELSVPISDSKYTDVDRYVFSWFKKDDMNNVYMITKDKHLILVPLKEDNTCQISGDNHFWETFWKAHREDFVKWENIIIDYAYDKFESENNDNFVDYNMAVDLHKFVPRILLNSLSIVLTFTHEDEEYNDTNGNTQTREVRKLSSIHVAVKSGKNTDGKLSTYNEDNLKDELRYKMANIDKSELTTIVRMTNLDSNNGNSYFNIPTSLWMTDEEVKLPEMWKTFLLNKFKVDPQEQLYRLANWLISTVDCKNQSRQALVLCGEGNDGKSTFIDVVSTFFNNYTNNNFAVPCPPNGFDLGNTQNGLINCIDARLITIADASDVKKLIMNDAFKNVTGGDEVVCQKKYAAPISKKMTGTKLLISTNNSIYMPQGCDTSRVIPMYFHPRDKNVNDFDVVQLKEDLIASFPDFLKWCYWYSTNINEHYSIEKNKTRIFKFDGSKTEKQCFETLCYKTQKFFFEVADEYAEEDKDIFSQFISEFIVYDNNACTSKSELLESWDAFAVKEKIDNVYRMKPKSGDLRNLYKHIRNMGEEFDVDVDTNYNKNDGGRIQRMIKGIKLSNGQSVYVTTPINDIDSVENIGLPI